MRHPCERQVICQPEATAFGRESVVAVPVDRGRPAAPPLRCLVALLIVPPCCLHRRRPRRLHMVALLLVPPPSAPRRLHMAAQQRVGTKKERMRESSPSWRFGGRRRVARAGESAYLRRGWTKGSADVATPRLREPWRRRHAGRRCGEDAKTRRIGSRMGWRRCAAGRGRQPNRGGGEHAGTRGYGAAEQRDGS